MGGEGSVLSCWVGYVVCVAGGYAGINFLRKKLQAFQDKNATVTLEAIR